MKYPSTFAARQSGCVAFFLVYNNAIEVRNHISFLAFFLPLSTDSLSFLFSMRKGVKELGSRVAVDLCGVLVHVRRRCPLWVAAFLWADDSPSSGWMHSHLKAYSLAEKVQAGF